MHFCSVLLSAACAPLPAARTNAQTLPNATILRVPIEGPFRLVAMFQPRGTSHVLRTPTDAVRRRRSDPHPGYARVGRGQSRGSGIEGKKNGEEGFCLPP